MSVESRRQGPGREHQSQRTKPPSQHGRVRPIVMYPFTQPMKLESLEWLFAQLESWRKREEFCKPLVIVNNQTRYRSSKPHGTATVTAAYDRAIHEVISPVADIRYSWAVDTCAMWLSGLGECYDEATKNEDYHDVFFLIPGDFDFTTADAVTARNELINIPRKVLSTECVMCVGEIRVPPNSAKQLIDTYGTYGLLYNWFPAEAKGIRAITDKPRTEFFATNYETLKQALVSSRWYAYEQTLIMLLQNMNGEKPVRDIRRVELGLITDDEASRSTLAGAMMQVERTERALKLFWREQAISRGQANWETEFRALDAQSESIRDAAMVILRRVLK